MNCNLKFGVLRAMQDIPAPMNGMGFGHNRDTQTAELLSGGRSVYTAPTSFKAYNMNWRGNTKGLQSLQDLFEGYFGPGPYYLHDPRYNGDNLLPQRWAASYQLAHISGGWANASEVPSPIAASGLAAQCSRAASWAGTSSSLGVVEQNIYVEAGKPIWLKAWGGAAAGGKVQCALYDKNGTALSTVELVPVASGLSVMIANAAHEGTYVKLWLEVPAGGSLALDHMDLTQADPEEVCPAFRLRSGKGVGAVSFTGNLTGEIVGGKTGRIGLSVEITEVEGV